MQTSLTSRFQDKWRLVDTPGHLVVSEEAQKAVILSGQEGMVMELS